MENAEQTKCAIRVFSFLMKESVNPSFAFPGGGLALKSVSSCLNKLEKKNGRVSLERIVDFCICQVYTISGFDENYSFKWKTSHSFGQKAIERFCQSTKNRKYYEDKWLKGFGISRGDLLSKFEDRSEHPLAAFIFPEYEETTKKRLLGKEAGFYICQMSTLLWTPFSTSCISCAYADKCERITKQKYPELHRIRIEAYNNK